MSIYLDSSITPVFTAFAEYWANEILSYENDLTKSSLVNDLLTPEPVIPHEST